MQMRIPFGKSWQEFEVPDENICFIGKGQLIPPLPNLEKAIFEQLDKPIGTLPLKKLVLGKKKIVILIEDNTRNTPLIDILPILVKYLNRSGIKDENISFLVAPGTHRAMTDEEVIEKVGLEMYQRFQIVQHDATKTNDLLDIGYVAAGGYKVPVEVNKKALEADLLIGIGDIVPHSDAGYSGGAKIVQPGICGFATTSATHIAAALLPDIPLGLVDNPCRTGMEEVAKKVGLSFILNIVKNLNGEIIGVFGGDFVKAHRRGVAMSEEAYKVEVPAPTDIVVVSSSPCDIDFWQAEKGLIAGYFAVKPGGIIIFAAPCPEGLAHNHPKFREWLALSLREIVEKAQIIDPRDISADLIAADIAACNSRIREKARIFFVTKGVSNEDIKILGYKRFKSVQAALTEAFRHIPNGSIGILPKGGVSMPVLSNNNPR